MIEIDEKFATLTERLLNGDPIGVQRAVFDLSPARNAWATVPDEVVERLLSLLEQEQMYASPIAAHILNYFEFESPRLTSHQKSAVLAFLKTHGDRFNHVHSQQVVTELRYDNYLK